MASFLKQEQVAYKVEEQIENDEEEDDDDELQEWDDWEGDDEEGAEGDQESYFLCLFCESKYGSCDSLFEHCTASHHFDFHGIRKSLSLDFYGSFRLINYIRSQVAENRCWSCKVTCQSNQDLQNHLHENLNLNDIKLFWDDDRYLKPFIQDDSLLYSFGEYEEGEDEQIPSIDEEELLRDLKNSEEICNGNQNFAEKVGVNDGINDTHRRKEITSVSDDNLNGASSSDKELITGKDSREYITSLDQDPGEGHTVAASPNLVSKHIKKVNENYFGAYSSFGIH